MGKLPRRVRVKGRGGYADVKVVGKAPDKMFGYKGFYYVGYRTEIGERLIEVKKSLGKKETFNTFLHEFIHAVLAARGFEFYSVSNKKGVAYRSVEKEERLVYALSDEITDMLQDNPELWSLLKDKRKKKYGRSR